MSRMRFKIFQKNKDFVCFCIFGGGERDKTRINNVDNYSKLSDGT